MNGKTLNDVQARAEVSLISPPKIERVVVESVDPSKRLFRLTTVIAPYLEGVVPTIAILQGEGLAILSPTESITHSDRGTFDGTFRIPPGKGATKLIVSVRGSTPEGLSFDDQYSLDLNERQPVSRVLNSAGLISALAVIVILLSLLFVTDWTTTSARLIAGIRLNGTKINLWLQRQSYLESSLNKLHLRSKGPVLTVMDNVGSLTEKCADYRDPFLEDAKKVLQLMSSVIHLLVPVLRAI